MCCCSLCEYNSHVLTVPSGAGCRCAEQQDDCVLLLSYVTNAVCWRCNELQLQFKAALWVDVKGTSLCHVLWVCGCRSWTVCSSCGSSRQTRQAHRYRQPCSSMWDCSVAASSSSSTQARSSSRMRL